MKKYLALVTLALTLACGGAGGGVGLGSSVGPYATSLAKHYEAENPGIACPTFNVGDEVSMNGFTFRVDEVYLAEPEASLPWIQNSDERRFFGKGTHKAVVVIASVRNDSPVATKLNLNMNFFTTDGEKSTWWPYNEELVLKERGWEELPSKLPPSKWMKWVGISHATPDAASGAVMRIYHKEKEYDPSDPRGRRKIDVLYEQAMVDVGELEDRGHINPEKRK